MEHAYHQAVGIIGVVVQYDIACYVCEVHLPVFEEASHQVAFHLIVTEAVQTFYRQYLSDDMCAVQSAVIVPYLDFFS